MQVSCSVFNSSPWRWLGTNFSWLFVLAIVGAASSVTAAKPTWKSIPAEILGETRPQIEADAPAEVLFWNIEVDDRLFPRERTVKEYIRYKIFVPEKADQVTTISGIESRGSYDRTDLQARLVLKDGKTQEFGKEAIKERTLAKQGQQAGFFGWLVNSGAAVTEKFLAVPGVEAGAVLEYQITRVQPWPGSVAAFVAQREAVPVRSFDYRARLPSSDSNSFNRTFAVNLQGAKLTEDKKNRAVTLVASNLRSVSGEPFVGPMTDYALTVLHCYEATNLRLSPRSGKIPPPKAVPATAEKWTTYATLVNWMERDRGWPTKRVKQVAAEIVAPGTSDAEKASLIHRRVRAMYQECRLRTTTSGSRREPDTLDDILDWKQHPIMDFQPEEFAWLAVALYKEAGFEAHTVMLPDRSFVRFDEQTGSPVFLPRLGIAVRVGKEWQVSMPQNSYSLPFGMVPWQQEAQVGLLALEHKQEFIPIPATAPERSTISTIADLQLEDGGRLHGVFSRRYTGHAAAGLREELRTADSKERDEIAVRRAALNSKIVEITVKKITGLENPEGPVEVMYDLQWPDYAARTKNRLILRPSVFRGENKSPFSATTRRYNIHFPYRWQEMDQVTINLPPSYRLESPSMPPSLPGAALSYQISIGLSREKRKLVLVREFTSNLLDVSRDMYPNLKAWYDEVGSNDQHEIILVKDDTAAEPVAPGK